MFECKACVRRCIRTVFADVLKTYRSPPQILSSRPLARYPPQLRQGYATEAIPLNHAPTPSPTLDVGIDDPYLPRPNRPAKQVEPFSKTSLEQELRWLRDPLKLGDNTLRLLRQDNVDKALAIVRLASKDVECTVSWNYMIDYYMSKAKVTDAVKLYNEVGHTLLRQSMCPAADAGHR